MKRSTWMLATIVTTATWAIGAQAQTPAASPADPRAGAWDRSMAAEARGAIGEARDELARGWSPTEAGYDVMVRLAWLSLRMQQADAAIDLYGKARSLPGAQPEASMGLASAYAMRGFKRLDAGEPQQARQDFRTALGHWPGHEEATRGLKLAGPEQRLDPEVWAGVVNQSIAPQNFSGWSIFAHLPWQLNDQWRLRFAARHVQTQTDLTAPALGADGSSQLVTTGRTAKSRQDELYASAGWNGRYVGVELMPMLVLRNRESTIPGEAVSLRVGRQYGVTVQQSAWKRDLGWGVQLMPAAFWWPTSHLGMSAGARYTHDPQGGVVSATAGVSFVDERLGVDLVGHLGTERWPLVMYSPTLTSVYGDLTAGATATATYRIADAWRLGLQGQYESVEVPHYTGSYTSLSAGLIWSPLR